MSKRLLSLSILFSVLHFCVAQTTFQKTLGGTKDDMGIYAHQTSDGGYLVAGFIDNVAVGEMEVFLAKLNANGDTLWTKNIGAGEGEGAFSIEHTTDGGYIFAGFTGYGPGDVGVYLLKTDANGNPAWSKAFGGISSANAYNVKQTADGGYIISGVANDFTLNDEAVYVIKTDANGDSLWTRTFTGTKNEEGLCVLQTNDGGYIVNGNTGSFGTPGQLDIWLIRLKPNGDTLWTKTLGGAADDDGHNILQTADGGFIISGSTNSFGAGEGDFCLIKTDSSGNPQWAKTYGGADSEEAYHLLQTSDGGYLITGDTRSFGAGSTDVYVVKTNATGDTLWTRAFGGLYYDLAVRTNETNDGGYIISGLTSSFGNGREDIYLIKTDANGNSGCNQRGTATVVTSPTMTVGGSSPVISFGTSQTTPVSIAGRGSNVSTLCVTVGLSEVVSGNSFLVYPNPATDRFKITLAETVAQGEVEVLDVNGSSVYKESIHNSADAAINLNNVSAGIYFVRVFNGETNSVSKIIITLN